MRSFLARQTQRLVVGSLCSVIGLPAYADTTNAPQSLTFLDSHRIWDKQAGFREPSGLAFVAGSGVLWSVSDDTPAAFRLEIGGDLNGDSLEIPGLEDPEGVAWDATGGRLLILSEKAASVFVLSIDSAGPATEVALLDMDNAQILVDALGGDPGVLSPEGITLDPQTGQVYIVNERNPRILIEISADLRKILSVDALLNTRGFWSPLASDWHLDVSGLSYDHRRDGLWIASDVGKCVYFLPLNGGLASKIDLAWTDGGEVRRVDNAEGISLNAVGDRLFVVSDDGKHSRVFSYSIE